MTTFPTIVYKDGGDHQRPGGTFSYVAAPDKESYQSLLENGWFPTLEETTEKKSVVSVETLAAEEGTDDGEPTRAEIEAKCKELGIKVHHKAKDETLLNKIEEKLSELD